MEIGGSFVFWAVLLGAAVLLLVAVSVRWAGPGELVVVLRGDRVARSRARGAAVRAPGLERFASVTTGHQVLPLVARATTRDGTDVVVLADLAVVVGDVNHSTPYVDPSVHAARAVEDALGAAVSRLDVEDLGNLVVGAREDNSSTMRLLGGVGAGLAPGTRLESLVITEVEARLTAPCTTPPCDRGGAM